ncbi:MAG: C/D box methylation guide ribonucleoprotein complex aNOP56 subunit [Promethearchaeota archaeon]
MDGYLVFGVGKLYCINDQLSVISELDLGQTPEEISNVYTRIRHGTDDPRLREFFNTLQSKKVERIFVESQGFAEELSRLYDVRGQLYEDVRFWRRVRLDFLSKNIASTNGEMLHEIAVEVSRLAIRTASEQSDQLIIQAMNSLDDVEKAQNLMVSRLREWFGLHFPEAAHAIENGQSLARIVAEGGTREQISNKPELVQLISESRIKPELLEQSMGAEVSEQDMMMIQALAKQILGLNDFREHLEKYLDDSMLTVAPNLRGLIGPVIGARLIGLAGGIEKLARFPASTIQVLGAEQALFRALKTGAKPPKHGVIFQHTLIHSAPWWQRGKIARILAGKIAIAARIDLYSGQYVADELKQNVLSRVAEVKRKYPTAPKKPPSKPQRHHLKRKRYGKRTKPHAPNKRSSKTKRK